MRCAGLGKGRGMEKFIPNAKLDPGSSSSSSSGSSVGHRQTLGEHPSLSLSQSTSTTSTASMKNGYPYSSKIDRGQDNQYNQYNQYNQDSQSFETMSSEGIIAPNCLDISFKIQYHYDQKRFLRDYLPSCVLEEEDLDLSDNSRFRFAANTSDAMLESDSQKDKDGSGSGDNTRKDKDMDKYINKDENASTSTSTSIQSFTRVNATESVSSHSASMAVIKDKFSKADNCVSWNRSALIGNGEIAKFGGDFVEYVIIRSED